MAHEEVDEDELPGPHAPGAPGHGAVVAVGRLLLVEQGAPAASGERGA